VKLDGNNKKCWDQPTLPTSVVDFHDGSDPAALARRLLAYQSKEADFVVFSFVIRFATMKMNGKRKLI